MKKISIIVAIDKQYGIGKNNQLLCHLPIDLNHFKTITSGHPVIMGRNTFLSLPKGALPNRINIVISDIATDQFENCIMATSIPDAIDKCPDDECFIIGGAMIYKQFFPIADELYITRIDYTFNADTFFPIIEDKMWILKEKSLFQNDEKTPYNLSFEHYIRKSN